MISFFILYKNNYVLLLLLLLLCAVKSIVSTNNKNKFHFQKLKISNYDFKFLKNYNDPPNYTFDESIMLSKVVKDSNDFNKLNKLECKHTSSVVKIRLIEESMTDNVKISNIKSGGLLDDFDFDFDFDFE